MTGIVHVPSAAGTTGGDLALIESSTKAESMTTAAIVAHLRTMTIKSPDDYEFVASIATKVKTQLSGFEKARKEYTAGAVNYQRSVNAFYGKLTSQLTEAELLCRQMMSAFAVADHAAQVSAVVAGLGNVPAPALPEAKGISSKIVTKFEITDPDLVARQFCSPDLKKIQAFLDNGGLAAIPGVRFFDAAEMVIRGERAKKT